MPLPNVRFTMILVGLVVALSGLSGWNLTTKSDGAASMVAKHSNEVQALQANITQQNKHNQDVKGPTTGRGPRNEGTYIEVEEGKVEIESSLSRHITPQSPLFVLNLPNSGDVAINRYFKCAGLNSNELGRFQAHKNRDNHGPSRWEKLGMCIDYNLHSKKKNGASPLDGCGDFRVWTQMDFISTTAANNPQPRRCSFPTLQPKTLRRLFQAHPNATVLEAIRDPEKWAESLSMDMKQRWTKWCNTKYGNIFPAANATKSEWAKFYVRHRKMLRAVVKLYPSLKFIELNLEAPAKKTAQMLKANLEIEETCWLDSAMKPDRPQDINYPIFVAALPKSGTSTTHDYLNCGAGEFEGAHQWTKFEDSRESVTVGDCIQQNLQGNRSIFHNCGDNKHWSDIGVLAPGRKCFYPTIEGGLEAMYESYPYGTIMNVIRDAHSWYRSARRWNNILVRWSKNCKHFPPVGSSEQDWVDFYHWHTHTVRQFAKRHPTMTYIEVKLESNETPALLEEYYGFDQSCWGHANVNKKK